MRSLSTYLSLLFFALAIYNVSGQEQDRFHIPEEDSIQIYDYKLKVSQLINPKPDSALFYIEKIKGISEEKNYVVGRAEANYLMASYYRRMQKLDSAVVIFETLLELSNQEGYVKGKALSYNGVCRMNYLLGNIDEAIAACQECLRYKDSLSPTDGLYTILPDTHIALASAYIRKNELQPAITNLLKVDSIHGATPLRPDIIAAAFQNLGNIYGDLEDYDTAENYYIKANEEFKKLPAQAANFYMQTTNRHLGEVYYFKERYNEADSLLQSSRAFFSAIRDERTVTEINRILGLLNIKTENYSKAEDYLLETLEFNKNNTFDYEASQSGIELAKLYLLTNQPSRAERVLQDVLQFNKGNQNSSVRQQVIRLLSDTNAQQGNFQEAFRQLQEADRIKDSLDQVQSAERIKEIEGQYQTESRDREIALLTSQNELALQQKRNQRNLLLAGLGIALVAGAFFFFLYRNRQKTNSKLRELDTAKSTFFANISHEFRTPLTLIKGPLEDHLAKEDISKNERLHLTTAAHNTRRLESLVDQLLALSKLESGHMKLQVKPGNLGQFISAQTDAFRFGCQEKDIALDVAIESAETTDYFDHDAVQKIVFNLIGNALKYTPVGGSIKVVSKRTDHRYRFEVSNTGEALNQEIRSKIFDRFYQTDTLNSGTGIGLALTKELVDLHKGEIKVASENGINRFAVNLPVTEDRYTASELLTTELQSSEVELPEDATIAVDEVTSNPEDAPILLIIDDNQEILNYVRTLFENTFEVHTGLNGKIGLETATKLVPDVIISDVMMPEMDGYEVADRLKNNPLTSHIPLILLTAKSDERDQLTGVKTGADLYVTKPFNSQILKASVQNLLDNRRKLQNRFAQEIILKPKEVVLASPDEKFLAQLKEVFDEQLTNPDFSVEKLSKAMLVSRMQLHRKLKGLIGQSANEFIRTQRLQLAADLLKQNKASVSEVGYTVGFNDPSYFSKCFKQEFGCTPSAYASK